jgi:hypothetical protein
MYDKSDIYADDNPKYKNEGEVMFLFEKIEMLYKFDKEMNTAVFSHEYGTNKSIICHIKKWRKYQCNLYRQCFIECNNSLV